VVAFLAVKSDVQAALDAGYAMKTIWEHMKETGRLRCRYETFTQHVKRYIKAAPVGQGREGPGNGPGRPVRAAKPSGEGHRPGEGSPRFQCNK
jgi:hypothetical protein